MKYQTITCKKALHKLKSGRLPFLWDLNIYRGCEHQCQYCYAIYSQKYLGSEDFYDTIYLKKNIASALEKQLSSRAWKRETINIGGVTDSYQPIEQKMQLMPEVLKVMINYSNPIIISTKSDLLLRDIELINQLSKVTHVTIAASITTLDEFVRKKVEKRAVSSERRFLMLQEIKENTNASIGVHMMPIIPYLTDSYENIEAIYARAYEIGVDYILPGTMYLRGDTKPTFLNFLKKEYKDNYTLMLELYQQARLNKEYKDNLYKMLSIIQKKYPVSNDYKIKMIENQIKYKEKYKQLSLFDG